MKREKNPKPLFTPRQRGWLPTTISAHEVLPVSPSASHGSGSESEGSGPEIRSQVRAKNGLPSSADTMKSLWDAVEYSSLVSPTDMSVKTICGSSITVIVQHALLAKRIVGRFNCTGFHLHVVWASINSLFFCLISILYYQIGPYTTKENSFSLIYVAKL